MKEDKKIKELESNLKKLFKLRSEKREAARNLTKDMIGYDRPESALIFLGCLMIICISFFPTFINPYIDFYGRWVWLSPVVAILLCGRWIVNVVKKETKYDKVYNEILENDEFCVDCESGGKNGE